MARKLSELELLTTLDPEAYTVAVQNGITYRYKPSIILGMITKQHAGLGNLDNFATADLATAQAGLANDKFMTPYGTAQYLTAKTASQVEAEAGVATDRFMTPQRTAQQLTAKIATQVEAEAGTVTDKFMTPQRTAQAIAALVNTNKDRYDLKVGSTTAVLDLAVQQVFTVNATTNRTLSFANVPGSSRSMTVVIELQGTGGTITWPTISWNGGTAPTLGATSTVVVLLWTGTKWIGSVGASF